MPDRRVELQTPLNTDAGRAARVGEIMRDAATRLRGVCANLSDDQFDALLRRIAEVTVKYEALPSCGPRVSPRRQGSTLLCDRRLHSTPCETGHAEGC